MSSDLDFRGARGSNTGDVYHELWAVRSALKLLDSETELKAITVEGVPSTDGSGHQWDGVDCALLFGGESIQTANSIVIQQLKYSASEPHKAWSPSRACYGPSSINSSSSLMRGLGKAFKEAVRLRPGKHVSDISLELITNQPVSNLILNAIEKAKNQGVPKAFSKKWPQGGDDLHRLVKASGLTTKEFEDFSKCLNFDCQTNSRFFLEEQMLVEISDWTQTEFAEIALRLRSFIRNKMMPEATGEFITKEAVLLQFGVTDQRALFPCPSKVKHVPNLVSRSISSELCQSIAEGRQRILLHGPGGVGKSTIVQEFGGLLPDGSEVLVFDCYGAGSYMDASAMRHRSRDAFVQLANELANRLNIPAFIEPKAGLDFAKAFYLRLILAAKTLSAVRPNAKLVIVVDAADNSITAADARVPKEQSFVRELVSFEELPDNVSLVVSARTGRLRELGLPPSFKPFELQPFSRPETGRFVAHHWNAPEQWIDDFHRLTNGTPRVQTYAFGKVSDKPSDALEPLRPNGKTLDVIFEDQFEEAVKKAGQVGSVIETCAALAVLPRPIPQNELAYALNMSEAQIADICSDLEPGVLLSKNTVSFADEDFENFALVKGQKSIPEILAKVASRMLANHKVSEYAALNVVPLLSKAAMGKELLDLVEGEPEPSARTVPDPVLRMEIRNQRLTNAISVCRSAENLERAMRFVLIGAEALETDDATRKILTEFPDLTARFARSTGSRLILSDPDLVHKQGPLLLRMLSQEALEGNFSQVRELRRRIQAWLQTRNDALREQDEQYSSASEWRIEAEDMANALVSRALEGGPSSATKLFRHWPITLATDAAIIAIKRLIVAGRFDVLQGIGSELSPPLAVFVLVPLRLAGQPVDLKKLAMGLRMLSRKYPISKNSLGDHGNSGALIRKISKILITGAEVLAAQNVDIELVKTITRPLWLPDARRCDKLYDHQSGLIDGILRSYCLHELCQHGTVNKDSVLVEPPPEPEDQHKKKKRTETSSERNVKEVVQHVASFYIARSQVILQKTRGGPSKEREAELLKSFSGDHWRFDQNYRSLRLRSIMSEGLIVLIAANTDIDLISKFGFVVRKDFWPSGETSVASFFSSLTAFSSMHSDLLNRATAAVSDVTARRMGAREKSELLAKIAEMITPISPEDANVVFQKAIAVAHELDSEAMDQIRFLNALVRIGGNSLSSDKKSFASKAAEFVIDAGIRLEDVEHFPWDEAVESIATLDFPTVLACIARWEDSGYVNSHQTLEIAIKCGLRRGDIDFVQAATLLKFVEQPQAETIVDILISSEDSDTGVRRQLVEEFARDISTGLIDENTEIEEKLVREKGSVWLARLIRLKSAKHKIGDQSELTNSPKKDKPRTESVLTKKSWEQETLSQFDLLFSSAEELLKAARTNEEYISLSSVLHHASMQVNVANRVKFLGALVTIIVEHDEQQIVDTLLRCINSWAPQLSVNAWCEKALPPFIEEALPFLVSRYAGDSGRLEEVIALAKLDSESTQQCILYGLEKNNQWLTSRQIFSLMQFLVGSLTNQECASLLSWYLNRLVERIDDNDKENIDLNEIPSLPTHAIAQYIVALMSDVDLRLRWKAAHAGRRLARLGHVKELEIALDLYGKKTDGAFRAIGKPYYWLAVRLWMMIMFDRICEESTTTISNLGERLLQIATDPSFPHILVRDFAADACRKLDQKCAVNFSDEQLLELSSVNSGIPTTGADEEPTGSYDFFEVDRKTERFHFNTMDTLRYWYAPWLRVFEGATTANFLNAAESWIVDEWGVIDEKPYGSREPRESRFNDRSFQLSSNSHGSLPTLEHYQTHLEWHAKWCAAGQFLAERPLKKSRYSDGDEYSELDSKVSYGKLTKRPYWIADFVTNRPIESHHWAKDFGNISEWVENIDDDCFLRELFPETEPDWVVIDEYVDTRSDHWDVTSKVRTGLVSPNTAMSLVRALQTCPNDMDFYVCPEGHNLEINETEYKLKGWIRLDDGDRRFDEKDPFRIDISLPSHSPGSAVTKFFNLREMMDDGLKWVNPTTGLPVFRLEVWGDKRADTQNRYLGDSVVSSGHRLLIEKGALSDFLQDQKMDIIADIGITKRDKSQGKQSVFEETKGAATYERILLLERSGKIDGAEQSFGTWGTDRIGTRGD